MREARITTDEAGARNRFLVQDSGGRKVRDQARLLAITQRLRQRFCGDSGLQGGVQRLQVGRFVKAEPPWEHEPLADAAAAPLEAPLWQVREP